MTLNFIRLFGQIPVEQIPPSTDPVVSTWIGSQLSLVNGRTVGVRKARCATHRALGILLQLHQLFLSSRSPGSQDPEMVGQVCGVARLCTDFPTLNIHAQPIMSQLHPYHLLSLSAIAFIGLKLAHHHYHNNFG